MSDSKIVKAPFVAMSDIRREIQTIDPDDPKIVRNYGQEHSGDSSNDLTSSPGDDEENEGLNQSEAISDPVIDGSHINVLEDVKIEADRLIEEAKVEAEAIKAKAKKEGYDLGYVEGQEAGHNILESRMQELDETGKRLALELEEEKEAFKRDLEPKVAFVIRDLLYKMVGKYEEDPSLIIFLIKLALEEIHTYGSFLIKVSDEDFDYVVENKSALTAGLSEKVQVEILKDLSMSKNQCFLETEMGNVDASLDLRLDALGKELKLIGDSLK